MLKKEHLNN